jgi:adenylyl-sulfate kinase
MKHTTQEIVCEVIEIKSVLDINSFDQVKSAAISNNGIGRTVLQTQKAIFCEPYKVNRATGSFILIDPGSRATVAAGIIEHVQAKAAPPTDSVGSAHQGFVVWFTGLPSSGKTTLSRKLLERLRAASLRVELLDGDDLRAHLSKDLGYEREDRYENIRRIAFVAGLLVRNGVVVLVSAIAPYRGIRDEVRTQIKDFVEVYVNAPLSVCQQRDVKGLYRMAREGKLEHLTGIDDPYEPPLHPEIECRTDLETEEDCANKVVRYIESLFPLLIASESWAGPDEGPESLLEQPIRG